MSLGTNIKNCREALKLSQSELGKKIGVKDKTISSWEHDRTEPDIEHLILLADSLETSIDALARDTDNIFKNPIKCEILHILYNILSKLNDVTKLELLKNVIKSFKN